MVRGRSVSAPIAEVVATSAHSAAAAAVLS